MKNDIGLNLLFCFIGLFSLFNCNISKGSLYEKEKSSLEELKPKPSFTPTPKPTISPGPLPSTTPFSPNDKNNFFYLKTNAWGATVYLNNIYFGLTPLSLPDLPYGTYYLLLEKEGYKPFATWITYNKSNHEFYFELEQLKGYLELFFKPENALATISNQILKTGRHTLPIGEYNLTISLFGYETFNKLIIIKEEEITRLEVELLKASFKIESISVNRKIINPYFLNPASHLKLDYFVNGPGTGYILIKSSAKELCRFGPFNYTSRLNSFIWNGQDESGKLLEPGNYTITIEATGTDSSEISSISLEIKIDAKYLLKNQNLWSGSAGLFYLPLPSTLPESTQELSATTLLFIEKNGNLFSPSCLGLRIGLIDRQELNFTLSSILSHSNLPSLHASLAYTRLIYAGEAAADFDLAFSGKISYQLNYTADLFTRPTGLSISLPLVLRLGAFGLGISPEIFASYTKVSYDEAQLINPDFYLWFYLRCGLYYEESFLRIGLSTALRTEPVFQNGLKLALPFQSAFEASFYIPNSPLYLTLALVLEAESFDSYFMLAGFSFGLLW